MRFPRRLLLVMAVIAVAMAFSAHPGPVPASSPASPSMASTSTPFDIDTVFASAATCADHGFFEHDQKVKCDASCKKGKKCVKKETCGDGSCPDPGYCWKCSN
jgi:hypothetical protein